jgi:3'-5' exoribonuclease
MEKKIFVKDLQDKTDFREAFLVKFASVGVGKTGKPFMNLSLMDKSGEIEARIWDGVDQYANQLVQDAFVWVEGRCQLYQGRKQVVIQKAGILREDEVDLKNFIAESDLNPEELYERLVSFVHSMKDPFYKALAESILIEDSEIIDRLKRAPAAKSVHHTYRTGLLEHIVSITETLDFMAKHYQPYVDRDLLFLGGFFHDIAKIWELNYERVTEYSDEGRLIGHLVMGVELVERKIQWLEKQEGRLPGAFPEEKRLLVKHVLLSHHGQLEYGSPKRPKCLEALIVHYIDDLDSKVNSIKCFIEQDENPGRWTGLHKFQQRFFFKPDWAFKDQE